MNIGDIVKHKHLGGVGIIVGTTMKHSNITMGFAEWVVVKWAKDHTGRTRDLYIPAFLELLEPTDKNCPPK